MKRKFKIIFVIVAVMAMLFAFAISSSASVYINAEGLEIGSDSYAYINVYTNTFESFESSCDEIFGFCILSSSDYTHSCYGLINIEFWDTQIVENNVKSSSDFLNMISRFGELGYVDPSSTAWATDASYYSNELYNCYLSWKNQVTEEDLEVKYNEGYAQGEIDGVTEYKESDEYAIILDSKYSTGKTDGVTEYKESEEYASVLLTKYNDGFVAGTAEGALAYAKSEAYKTALAEEYDKGYDDGFVDGEAQIDVAPIIGVVVVLGLAIGALVVVKVIQKRKLR